MTLTVACVFVKGHVPFTSGYVRRLQSMVSRALPVEHQFVCLTDRPFLFMNDVNIKAVDIPSPTYGVFAWWRKLHLFDPSIQELQSGRCLYLDLDTIIVGSLEPIIGAASSMALIPDDAPNFRGKGSRLTVKKFNSSVVVWNGGQFNSLFTEFKVSISKRLWGDQDWIGERNPDAATMPLPWFPRLSQCLEGPGPEARVVLCKKPKNTLAAQSIEWVREAWV